MALARAGQVVVRHGVVPGKRPQGRFDLKGRHTSTARAVESVHGHVVGDRRRRRKPATAHVRVEPNDSLYRQLLSTVCAGAADGFSKDTGTMSPDGKTWTGSGTASFQYPSAGYSYTPINYTFTLNPDGTLTRPWPNNWTRAHP